MMVICLIYYRTVPNQTSLNLGQTSGCRLLCTIILMQPGTVHGEVAGQFETTFHLFSAPKHLSQYFPMDVEPLKSIFPSSWISKESSLLRRKLRGQKDL